MILVVSSDAANRDLICRELLGAGYTVSAAADDTTARQLLRDRAFDLVLLDSAAGGADAQWTTTALRGAGDGLDAPAVLALDNDRGRQDSGSVAAFLGGRPTEPFEPERFAAQIELELARRRARLASKRPAGGAERPVAQDASEPAGPNSQPAVTMRILVDALEAISEGFVLWDAEDRLVICNEGYRKLFGCNGNLVGPGARFEDLMRLQLDSGALRVASNRRHEWLTRRIAQRRGPKASFEDEISDGSWVRITEYRTAAGYTVGIATEISQFKRRETALKMLADSNRRLAEAVDATSSAMLITDPRRSGNPTVFANQAFAAMTGWPVEEALGRDRSFLNGPHTDMDEVSRFEGDMRAGRPTSAELQLKIRNGRSFWADISASPIRDKDGRVVNWVIIQTDITARKEATHQAPRPQETDLTGQPSRQASPDLDDLVTAIRGNLEAVLKASGKDDADATAVLESLIEDAFRRTEATRRMRTPSRRTTASATINPGPALFGFK